ncbi:hypothetical protein H0H81_010404 [Sphagnurus paluster]|uniref:Uncharacterized protein n=1 Tax=Sphagnurus paluster TaxID=117069 RepID=A0A9P7K5B9_9AGAR|nr:hypothetical protein H0H81_010404 [Sphagnurus paluster]
MSTSPSSGPTIVPERSIQEQYNIFLWYFNKEEMPEICWRVTDEQPMTVAQMYRYVRFALIESLAGDVGGPRVEISCLRRVTVRHRTAALKYRLKPLGPHVAENSDEHILAGDNIVICGADGKPRPCDFECRDLGTFASECRLMYAANSKLLDMAEVPADLRNTVLARDGNTCCATGSLLAPQDAVVTWIIPPPILSAENYKIIRLKFKSPFEGIAFLSLVPPPTPGTHPRPLQNIYLERHFARTLLQNIGGVAWLRKKSSEDSGTEEPDGPFLAEEESDDEDEPSIDWISRQYVWE